MFEKLRVADLEAILAALDTISVMTAYRRLSELGYLSSYSHRGRYYTLAAIPDFDADGLWIFEGIGFSRHGTLRDTVPSLVERSEAGLFHRDLEARLQVRVHDTLLALVQARRLAREAVKNEYVYVSGDPARARQQIELRREGRAGLDAAATRSAILSPVLIIEILLDVVHAARLRCDPAAVVGRLQARGVAVTLDEVRDVFRHHGVPEKKTRYRPRR